MKPSNTATAVVKSNVSNKAILNSLATKENSKKETDLSVNSSPEISNKTDEVLEPKKQYTIEELKNKSIALDALTEKHNAIIDKIQDLEKFKVLHEESQAKITITDVNGLSFESTNHKTIAQVIKLWKENFEEAKNIIEDKIRLVYSE